MAHPNDKFEAVFLEEFVYTQTIPKLLKCNSSVVIEKHVIIAEKIQT